MSDIISSVVKNPEISNSFYTKNSKQDFSLQRYESPYTRDITSLQILCMKKVAIVHEMLIKLGGAEKVVETFVRMFPDTDIFTLMYDEKQVSRTFPKSKIHPQVYKLKTQKIYNLLKRQRFCLPFMARSIESLDLSEYDLVLVSSSGFAHGVITKPETKTIVYYHAPMRYVWDWTNEYKKQLSAQSGIKWYIFNSLFLRLRQWDFIASKRNDVALANSQTTQKRLEKYYKIQTPILYPPIETQRFAKSLWKKPKQKTPYYIILSALTEFKKIEIAIQNFPDVDNLQLSIIGAWEYKPQLQSLAGENIDFLGAQYGDDLVELVQSSLGLIFPGEEDFGIVPIEVMAAGKPIFALRKWWLTETVIEGKTWEFFNDPKWSDFLHTFTEFHKKNISWAYKPQDCIQQAKKYDISEFETQLQHYIKNTLT